MDFDQRTGLHKGFFVVPEYSIIFWDQIATYRGHASLKILNQPGLWFCVYYIIKAVVYLYISPTGGNKLAIYNLTITGHLKIWHILHRLWAHIKMI